MTNEHRDRIMQLNIEDDIRVGRPFYIVFTVVLITMYVLSLVSNPALRNPSRLFPFTLMIVIHAALHWVSLYLTYQRRWLVPYFVVQGVLLFAINYMGQNQGLLLGLYFAQIGAVVGILGSLRTSLVPIVAYLVLAAVNFVLVWGLESVAWWFAISIPMGLFVIIYVTMFNRQASARRRAQQLLLELETAHNQLAEYAARVEELTLSAERQRMARELHDTLAQGLAGLILQLEAVDSHLGRDRLEQAQTIVQHAMSRARATLADARRAIQDLRTASDAPDDLKDSVQLEVDRFSAATGIPCVLELNLPEHIPVQLIEHTRRAAAEGLTNVARHAQASQVWLRVGHKDGMLEIGVRDDGLGFEPRLLEDSSGHYGLIGLRERARLAGGTLEVTSTPGEGTELIMRLPLESRRDDV